MDLSRRCFLGGLASFGATRMFAAVPGTFLGPGVRLRFGVVSDIHVRTAVGDAAVPLYGTEYDTQTFLAALRYFDGRGADAVLVTGDLADNGLDDQLRAVGAAWDEVFPGDRAADGRTVTKLFVGGNHDWEGWKYGRMGEKRFPDEAERKTHVLAEDYPRHWEAAFHEKFQEVFVKDVKGYRFIGAHWPYHKNAAATIAAATEGMDGTRPFFYAQHPHLKDTAYGPWAWGHDAGNAGRALAKFPNAVAFSGHSHYSLTDERSVWQGAFVAVGAGSLRYTGKIDGYENSGPMRNSGFKQMEGLPTRDCRQGLFVSVYDDRIVLERREFVTDTSLGDDWVIPLTGTERPYAFARRAAEAKAPAFAADAVPTLSEEREGRSRDGRVGSQVTLTFPPALPSSSERGRAFAYEIRVLQTQGDFTDLPLLTKRVFPSGFNFGEGDPRTREPVACVFNARELPHECPLTFEVTALECFGRRSKPIVTPELKMKGVVVKW